MIIQLTDLLNQSSADKHTNDFYIEFANMESNIGNFLASRVVNFTPPALETDATSHNVRRNMQPDVGRIVKMPITITFRGDHNGLTEMFLLYQFQSQMNNTPGKKALRVKGAGMPEKFDIKVQHINQAKEVKYVVTYRNCFISNITMPDLTSNESGMPALYGVTVFYDTTDYQSDLYDELIRQLDPD